MIYKYHANECTKVQNPRYKDVTLKAYTSASARDRISTWTCEFMDTTLQIAEEQLVMMIDKAQETKLQIYKS